MAYRPYPDADRALRQLRRHDTPSPTLTVLSPHTLRRMQQTNLVLEGVSAAFRPMLEALRDAHVQRQTAHAVTLMKLRRPA